MASGESSSKKAKLDELKIFNDPVHGTIRLHPLCVIIIDTPQVQRLRRIKQLGACYHVYPGATHNRFEHSIGVAHLARKMLDHLNQSQPELDITEVDILCVTIAGLCHDLGHGPFSHLFDQQFLPQIEPQTTWTHEKASIDMFDHIIQVHNLRKKFIEHGFEENELDTDLIFIKELIYGPLPGNSGKLKGRPRDKHQFLYEIISNKRTSVDVDKWDYFARDCLMVGMKSNFDHMRCIKFSRVIDDGTGKMLLCLRDKEVSNIYEMFHIRNNIHRQVCKHAVSLAVDLMHVDALVSAEKSKVLEILGKYGKMCSISECKDDMVAFTKLNDNIFHQILHSTDEKLREARELLERVELRQLYKCIGQAILPADFVHKRTAEIKKQGTINKYAKIKELEKEILQELMTIDDSLSGDKIAMKFVDFDYSMKDKNPVDNMRFFSKSNPDVAKPSDEVSRLLPKIFEEHMMCVYYKDKEMSTVISGRAQKAFETWGGVNDCKMKTDRWQQAQTNPAVPAVQRDPAVSTNPAV